MILLWAFFVMLIQQLVYAVQPVASNRGHVVVASSMNALGYLAGIVSIAWTLAPIQHQGWTGHTLFFVGIMAIANFVGAFLGSYLGYHLISREVEEEDAEA